LDHKTQKDATEYPFPVGTIVEHPKHGKGRVERVDTDHIEVLFDKLPDSAHPSLIMARNVAEKVMKKIERTDADAVAAEMQKQRDGEIPTPTPSAIHSKPGGEHLNPKPRPASDLQLHPEKYQPSSAKATAGEPAKKDAPASKK
jgi:hypothetical protein